MAAVRSRPSVPPVDVKRHHRDAVKKASYYVWFLGAKECRGLSGDEYVHPAVRHLIEKENNVEPLKVTLQVSSKGMKIVYNNSHVGIAVKNAGNKSSSAGKEEQPSKHFIPDNNICYVTQEVTPNDDIVACIVLIPITKCPLHVHVYRCDSVETATVLRHHLQSLVERPENQKKMAELEQQQRRLLHSKRPPAPLNDRPPQVIHPRQLTVPNANLEERDSTGGSSSSDRENYMLDERMSILHESLTAELREKLNNRKNDGPLLLPPKDYDKTLRRMREADKQRPGLVSMTASRNNSRRNTERDSSGKSSGIGSDEAPSSPTHERGNNAVPFTSGNVLPAQTNRHSQHHDYNSSEEDECWNVDEERLVAAVKKPTFSDVKRSSSPQPLVVNMDPSNDLKGSRTKAGIWPPPPPPAAAVTNHRRVPLSPSKSYDDQPSLALRHKDVRRNESLGAHELRYHELPHEMRYPGLDRETAAPLPFVAPHVTSESNGIKKTLSPTSPVREYDWDRHLRHYVPAERNPSNDDVSYRYQQHPSMKRSSRPPVVNNGEDERRFYRYSSPDMEAVTNTNYRY